MENYRTWDNLDKLRGIVKLVNNENPYREGVEEYYLVEYIKSLEGKTLLNTSVDKHELNILKIFAENNIVVSGDPWYLYDLFARAIWLARAAGCIQIQKNTTRYNTSLTFACHFEAGMINYSKDKKFMKELTKVKNLERREALSNVLKIGNYFFEEANMPYITTEGNNVTINYHDLRKKNIHEDNLLSRTESIPYQTVSKPDVYSTDITTRGLFHHLGDDVAFMFAASEYGEVYVVGNDEFGDLIILGGLPYSKSDSNIMKFKVGETISSQDVDFLYGVPRSEARYPSKFNSRFNYSTEKTGNCKLNNEKNSAIGNYWDSDVFKEYAKRKIDSYTFNEFSDLMKNKIHNVLNREKFQEQKNAIEQITNYFNSNEVTQLTKGFSFKDNQGNYYCNLKAYLYPNSIEVYLTYDDFYFLDKASTSDEEKGITKIYSPINQKNINTYFEVEDIPNLNIKIKDFLLESEYQQINNKEVEKCFNEIELILTENCKKYLEIIQFKKIFKNDDFNEAIYKELSLFYKTTAHKVHCEIINPTSESQLGFFLKNTKNQSKMDGNLFIEMINSHQNILKKGFIEFDFNKQFGDYFLNRLYKDSQLDSSYKELLNYWKNINNKAFVVSDLVDMQNEYRIFVVNHKPVAGSPCFRNSTPFDAYHRGRFDPRLCVGHSAYETYQDENTRIRVAQYAKFAKQFCKEMKTKSPDTGSYVLDVAWSDDINGPLAIEINTVSWSGAYQTDMRRVCAAVAKKPFYYSDMVKYGNYEKVMKTINRNDQEQLIENENIEIQNSLLDSTQDVNSLSVLRFLSCNFEKENMEKENIEDKVEIKSNSSDPNNDNKVM